MENFEYIKWYLKAESADDPVVILYEVDLINDRYATRAADIFEDRRVVPVIDKGWPWVTEVPLPTVQEINSHPFYSAPEFCAETITREEFDEAYSTGFYTGSIGFPEN